MQTPQQTRQARRRTRPPVVQDRIVRYVRERIIGGQLKPGDRVPGRVELERRFKVSNLTVQRAFDRLVADGFVVVHGRRGTYVADRPPHTRRYGLAFPSGPGARDWVGFWQVMAQVAPGLLDKPRDVLPYHNISCHLADGDLALLNEDVTEHRLAGVIFSSPPFLIRGAPALTENGMPRVAISSHAYEGVPCTVVPSHTFVQRAVEFLASRGRKRLAMITPWQKNEVADLFEAALASVGLPFEPRRIQGISPSWHTWSYNLTHALLHGSPDERPDGLIVADDNHVPAACTAIRELGIHTPSDLDVVAHCNFPEPSPADVLVYRLGYDIPALLRRCVELIDDMRAGKEVPQQVDFPVQFEWELEGKPGPA